MAFFRSNRTYALFEVRSRFPLYLLLHFVPQKDAAAIGAIRKNASPPTFVLLKIFNQKHENFLFN
ncbi:hypothetical protein CBW16_09410 [Flavobacteriaceae bacterium JJC]|nr:hypothetical protein CBW16_09410 [Flavobacteriaceae bacterium JJC]